jgi:cephalosporin hydroxylase
MKNHTAQAQAKITLDNNGEQTTVDIYSREGFDLLSNLWIKSAAQHRMMYEPTWLGLSVIQFPTDIVAIQELIWKLQPDVIVETGVAHGGSLVLSASILELIGNGKVIGVDIDIRSANRAAIEAHPLKHRIELIEGSSIAGETIAAVRAALGSAGIVMIMLDSNHTESHVLQELELYSPLVTLGSYIVAQDGAQAWVWDIPRGKPEWKDDHPLGAIHKFLDRHPDFLMDPHFTRWGITQSPDGFLKRVSADSLSSQ